MSEPVVKIQSEETYTNSICGLSRSGQRDVRALSNLSEGTVALNQAHHGLSVKWLKKKKL